MSLKSDFFFMIVWSIKLFVMLIYRQVITAFLLNSVVLFVVWMHFIHMNYKSIIMITRNKFINVIPVSNL